MTINAKIEKLRSELRKLRDEETEKKLELHELFLDKANLICPIKIGTKIEYEAGKFGLVDRIVYAVDLFCELELNAEVQWAVTGRKISKTGSFGTKDFKPVGPATHIVNGFTFKRNGLAEIFGIEESDD